MKWATILHKVGTRYAFDRIKRFVLKVNTVYMKSAMRY